MWIASGTQQSLSKCWLPLPPVASHSFCHPPGHFLKWVCNLEIESLIHWKGNYNMTQDHFCSKSSTFLKVNKRADTYISKSSFIIKKNAILGYYHFRWEIRRFWPREFQTWKKNKFTFLTVILTIKLSFVVIIVVSWI